MSNKGNHGLGLFDVIIIINIILKIVGVISWSWWVVLWPLWFVMIIVILAEIASI